MSARVGDGLPEVTPGVPPQVASSGDVVLDRVGWSALRYRPFQVFFGSMLLSTTANFVYYAALGWYVAEVTGSAAAVGMSFTSYGAAGHLAEPTSARFAVLLGGIALGTAAFVVWRIRPQIATLAITRDGVTLTGDLAGSGVEPVERAA